MRQCKCGHSDHEHKLDQLGFWPVETPMYRGGCYKCNCCLFVDSRQMTIEETYGEITIQ